MQTPFSQDAPAAQAFAISSQPHKAGELSEAQVGALRGLVPYAASWVNWGPRALNKAGEPKTPINPKTGRAALVNKPETCGTFAEAVAQVCASWGAGAGAGGGVGLLMTDADAENEFTAIDADDCRDPDSGRLTPFGAELVRRFAGTYIEISPSGRGLRIFCLGLAETVKRLVGGGSLEIYQAGAVRFLRVTGATLTGTAGKVTPCQDGLDWLMAQVGASGGAVPANEPPNSAGDGVARAETSASGGPNNGSGSGQGSDDPLTRIEAWFKTLREDESLKSYRLPKDPAEVLAEIQQAAAAKPRSQTGQAFKGETAAWKGDESARDFFLVAEVIRRGCDSLEDVDTVLMQTGAKRAKWGRRSGQFGDWFTQTVHNVLKSEVGQKKKGSKPAGKAKALDAGGVALTTTASGEKIKPTLGNVRAILKADAPGLFQYDSFRNTVMLSRGIAELGQGGKDKAGRLHDDDYARIAFYLESKYGMAYRDPKELRPVIYAMARDNTANPVKDRMLELAAQWEAAGKPEVLNDWLEKYLNADTDGVSAYVSKVGRISLVQACRLVFREEVEQRWEHGEVQAQSMPVFIGNGSDGKGKALAILAGAIGKGLYQGNKFNLSNPKSVVETLSRFLIVEWQEYGPNKDTSDFKQSMTTAFFTHRTPWSVESEDFYRYFSIFATSNDEELISDPSNGEARRLWPVYLQHNARANLAGLGRAAPMLWGQAAWLALNTDERHWIDSDTNDPKELEVMEQWEAVIRRCRISDPLEEKLDDYLTAWASAERGAWGQRMESSNAIARAIGAVDPMTNIPTAREYRVISKLLRARGMRPVQMPGDRRKGWLMTPKAYQRFKE